MKEVKKEKTRDELIDSVMLNKIIKYLENDDKENALHFMYALKMCGKE